MRRGQPRLPEVPLVLTDARASQQMLGRKHWAKDPGGDLQRWGAGLAGQGLRDPAGVWTCWLSAFTPRAEVLSKVRAITGVHFEQ